MREIRADLASNRRTLRAFHEMNYVLVPDAQPLVPIRFDNLGGQADGSFVRRLVSPGGPLNAPWGVGLALWGGILFSFVFTGVIALAGARLADLAGDGGILAGPAQPPARSAALPAAGGRVDRRAPRAVSARPAKRARMAALRSSVPPLVAPAPAVSSGRLLWSEEFRKWCARRRAASASARARAIPIGASTRWRPSTCR